MKKLFILYILLCSLISNAQLSRYSGGGGGSVSSLLTGKVNVKDFGAIGDGTSHPLSGVYGSLGAAQAVYPTAISLTEEIDGLAIQTAIDYVIYGAAAGGSNASGKIAIGRSVYLPNGKFLCSRTIHMGYGNQFTSVNLIGEDQFAYDPYVGGANAVMKGAVMVAQFNNAPLLNIQGARADIIRGIQFVGQNTGGPGYSATMITPSAYINGSLPRSASARYSPYAGISIDGWNGAKPTDTTGGMVPYPDMNYPASIGVSQGTQWNRSASSGVIIEKCKVVNFVVGICTDPSGGDNNGDFTSFADDMITACYVGICITQTQARLASFLRCQIDQCFYCLDNSTYGIGKGRLISAQSCHFSGYAILNIQQTDYNSPFTMKDCYGETLVTIGQFGIDRSTASGIVIENTDFSFFNPGNYIPLTIFTIASKTKTTFRNCRFTTYPTTIVNSAQQDVEFDGCTFDIETSIYKNQFGYTNTSAFSQFITQTGGIVTTHGHKIMKGCNITSDGVLTPQINFYSTGQTIVSDNDLITNNYLQYQTGSYDVDLQAQKPRQGYIYRLAYGPGQFPVSGQAGFLDSLKATYVVQKNNAGPTGYANEYMSDFGTAYIGWNGAIFINVGKGVGRDTLFIANGYSFPSTKPTSYQFDTSTSTLSGQAKDFIETRMNRNPLNNALLGTATSGTAVISSVTYKGSAATSGQMNNAIDGQAMAYIYTCSDPAYPTSGWYGPYRIVSVDGTAKTITLDRNVTVTGTVHVFNTCSY